MFDYMQLAIDPVTTLTNTWSADTSEKAITGKIYAIHLDVSANADVDVDIVTVAKTDRPAQTLLSVDDVTADAWYYPRALAQTSAGADMTEDNAVMFPVVAQTIQLKAQDAAANTDTVTATIIYVREE